MNEPVNVEAARSEEYREVLQKILADGKCPFCEENFRYHREPIIYRNGDWILTKNSYSYKEAELALLILNPKLHMERYEQMTWKENLYIANLVVWAVENLKIKGGGVAIRFGDPVFTGASVRHLHAHLIVPKIGENGKAIPVYFPIG